MNVTSRPDQTVRAFAAWLFLAPLVGSCLLFFGARLRGAEWLPGVLPFLYLGVSGGLVTAAGMSLMSAKSLRSPLGCAGTSAAAATLAWLAVAVLHDIDRLIPIDGARWIILAFLLAVAVPLAIMTNRNVLR